MRPQSTTVRVDVRIRYQDQSQVSGARSGPQLGTWLQPHRAGLQAAGATPSANTAQRSVSISRGKVASSVSSGTSTMSIVLYGALTALVACAIIAVVLAIVAVRRRRRAEHLMRLANSDSITLGIITQKRQARTLPFAICRR